MVVARNGAYKSIYLSFLLCVHIFIHLRILPFFFLSVVDCEQRVQRIVLSHFVECVSNDGFVVVAMMLLFLLLFIIVYLGFCFRFMYSHAHTHILLAKYICIYNIREHYGFVSFLCLDTNECEAFRFVVVFSLVTTCKHLCVFLSVEKILGPCAAASLCCYTHNSFKHLSLNEYCCTSVLFLDHLFYRLQHLWLE